ncbi:MAG: tocopherol cyclase family protein [Bdellovibrionota bacterium]
MKKLTSLLVLLVHLFAFAHSGTAAESLSSKFDPYNALIWNSENRKAQNGKTDREDWYEWWYYKVVVPNSEDAFYFVYGVVNPWDANKSIEASRAYVGFGSFADHFMLNENHPPSEFQASTTSAQVKIGPHHHATDRRITGQIGNEARWDIQIEHDWTFNAMGWAMSREWISNIYWYPAQASARMTGWVESRGRRVEFKDAPAYQDRNWGRSFPEWWAWLVSNRFKNSPDTVLAAGGGKPRLLDKYEPIESLAIGLRHKGKVYAFRPSEGDIVRVDIKFGKWEVRGFNRKGEQIRISAWAPQEKFMDLQFVTPQGKVFHDFETLRGNIKVQLFKWRKLIADLETDEGGIEYGSHEVSAFDQTFSSEMQLQ